VPPLCGEVVAMMWLEPGTQENVCVELYGVPSTVNARPAGFVRTVTWTVDVGVAVGVAVAVAVAVAAGVLVAVAVAVAVGVAVGVGVGLSSGVGVGVGVKVAVAVGVGVGVEVGLTTRTYLASLGMPLVKTVTKAGPGGKLLTGVEVKAVSDQPATGSTGRKVTWLLSMSRNWTTG